MDALPYIPERVARAIFTQPKYPGTDISFEEFWDQILEFYHLAQNLTNGTRPEKDVSLTWMKLKNLILSLLLFKYEILAKRINSRFETRPQC